MAFMVLMALKFEPSSLSLEESPAIYASISQHHSDLTPQFRALRVGTLRRATVANQPVHCALQFTGYNLRWQRDNQLWIAGSSEPRSRGSRARNGSQSL